MGVFEYDLFPYFICFEISKITADGEYIVDGIGSFKSKHCLDILPFRTGKKLDYLRDEVSAQQRLKHDKIDKELLADISKRFPFLRDKSRHYKHLTVSTKLVNV